MSTVPTWPDLRSIAGLLAEDGAAVTMSTNETHAPSTVTRVAETTCVLDERRLPPLPGYVSGER